MIATAPGKLIVSGEYAVLDGASALVIAIDRRAIARPTGARTASPFLDAVCDEVARRRGPDAPAVRTARTLSVDSTAFYDRDAKLGLGSSAAVTVAATALAIAGADGSFDRDEVLAIAMAAHAAAQAGRHAGRSGPGTSASVHGSGADVAAAVHGGAIVYARSRPIARVAWPASVRLIPFFTGHPADTATLVDRVDAARVARRAAVDAALSTIAEVSVQLCELLAAVAPAADAVVEAFERARTAVDELAHVSGVELVPACVTAAARALGDLAGTAKTTGAGGGDVGIAVIPSTADVTIATGRLIQAGCQPLRLLVDDSGVDTRPEPQ